MSCNAVKNYIISNDDVQKLQLFDKNCVPICKLSHGEHFKTAASSLKLISLLSFFGQVKSLVFLSEAGLQKNQLSELSSFEAYLYLCAVRGFRLSKATCYIQEIQADWIIVGDKVKLLDKFQGSSIAVTAIIVKYLCMWGHTAVAIEILKQVDLDSRNCVLTHLSSISALFGEIKQPPQGQLHERWNSYFQNLSKILLKFSHKSVCYFEQNYIQFLSSVGEHESAYALVRKYRAQNNRLYYFVQLQRALSKNKVAKAIEFADRLILTKQHMTKINDHLIPFDRDVAESALCEANSLLRGAGVAVFIISGTLLGCIRDGRIFEHDKDFDLGIIGWENQFTVAQILMRSPNFTFSPKRLLGHNLFHLTVFHIPSGYAFDIFFYHADGHKIKHAVQFSTGFQIEYSFSRFELLEREFLGEKFLIPENYELFLDENYGKDWRTPNPNYFVKLESPALVEKSGDTFAYSIRHEILNMLGERARPQKGYIFIEKMKRHASRQDQPKPAVLKAFLNKLTLLSEIKD
jgi:hypothetical protein